MLPKRKLLTNLEGYVRTDRGPSKTLPQDLGLGRQRKTTESCNKIRFTRIPEFKEEERCYLL
jgi:hypothetical protein